MRARPMDRVGLKARAAAGTGESSGRPWRRYRVGPVVVDAIRRPDLVDALVAVSSGGQCRSAAYVNAHVFELLYSDGELAAATEAMDIVFCDGFGALLGFRALGAPVPERMTPPDFIDEVLGELRGRGGTVFLLGDETDVVARMADVLEVRWPGIVAGIHDGFFPPSDLGRVAARVVESRADLVLVAMGSPRQELTIVALRRAGLGASLLAVGGLFRWYSGVETRGPRWATDHGLEWLFRLLAQPRRTVRRYLFGLPRFGLRLAGLRLLGRYARLA